MPHHAPAGEGADAICFGLNRTTDENSLRIFLQRFAAPSLLATLVPRLTDQEISACVDLLTQLLKNHLSEKEYHRLFLSDYLPHDKGAGKGEL